MSVTFLSATDLAGHIDGEDRDPAVDVAPAAQVEGEQDRNQVLSNAQHTKETHNLHQ